MIKTTGLTTIALTKLRPRGFQDLVGSQSRSSSSRSRILWVVVVVVFAQVHELRNLMFGSLARYTARSFALW